jgi:hypothetical protein
MQALIRYNYVVLDEGILKLSPLGKALLQTYAAINVTVCKPSKLLMLERDLSSIEN